ncbi:hypothetical protein BDQ94DRAFT_154866 [Aspergillus welwitschiae]|uniref:Uncharacterized protein n=1 Tax=Aspergillus welwitschiae TaxID=1341132 RepID=A0A3F3PIT1_9EURO|nr:hypothetical protein BDQ94DRAFT_154866 [Aspergillus welwitschiae]RDH26860.1 hypothetical protein BDQ94DRAFT_154866 [Aspergillus welwitschiae]
MPPLSRNTGCRRSCTFHNAYRQGRTPTSHFTREQKQWNQDFKETVYQNHRSLFGSGTKKGTTRGKATSS